MHLPSHDTPILNCAQSSPFHETVSLTSTNPKLSPYTTVPPTTHRVEMVNEAIEDGGDEVAYLTPVWQLTLIVLLGHVVHQIVLVVETLGADATPQKPCIQMHVFLWEKGRKNIKQILKNILKIFSALYPCPIQ